MIVRVNALVVLCAPTAQLSVACTVKLYVPAEAGIPEMKPDVLMLSPDGREPEIILKDTGACPPVVVI